jgi:hypothetical protein
MRTSLSPGLGTLEHRIDDDWEKHIFFTIYVLSLKH